MTAYRIPCVSSSLIGRTKINYPNSVHHSVCTIFYIQSVTHVFMIMFRILDKKYVLRQNNARKGNSYFYLTEYLDGIVLCESLTKDKEELFNFIINLYNNNIMYSHVCAYCHFL